MSRPHLVCLPPSRSSLSNLFVPARCRGSCALECRHSSGRGRSTPGVLPGRAVARTGLRLMPTFPSPPLKFGTAGFPQYGFKAGVSEVPSQRGAQLSRAHLVCLPPSRSRFPTCLSPLGVGAVVRWSAAIRATVVALPQGSLPGRAVARTRLRMMLTSPPLSLSELTRLSPSQRGLLHPGFRRIGHPLRRRI